MSKLWHNFSIDEVNERFEHLEKAFKGTELNNHEFMLMHETEEGILGFKHHLTRNYVFLLPNGHGYELYVPKTEKPFMRGEFTL